MLSSYFGCFGCFWYERYLFLKTQASEMSILVTGLTLLLLGWTLESFHMAGITTFGTPIFTCMSLFGIKHPLVWWHLLLLTCIPLVIGWSWLESFFFVFALWEVCLLVSHQIDLSHLGVTSNLFDVMHSLFWCLQFLCKLPDLACKKLIKINPTVIDSFDIDSSFFQEKP